VENNRDTTSAGSLPVTLRDHFELFPNPASDYITIRTTKFNNQVSIFNSAGTEVYSKTIRASDFTIPVNKIGKPGLYFIKVNNNPGRFVLE
jgi:uncharacterized protein (UPF0333 family)